MYQSYPLFIQQELEKIKSRGGVSIVHDEEYTYVLLALGERKTGGYEIKVLEVEKKREANEEYILVKAKEKRPDPGDMVIQVITYPVSVYQIPKTTLPIRVEWVRGRGLL